MLNPQETLGPFLAGANSSPILNKQNQTIMLQITGAAAAEGLPLAKVAGLGWEVARTCATMGIALEPCTLPGSQPSNRYALQLSSYTVYKALCLGDAVTGKYQAV